MTDTENMQHEEHQNRMYGRRQAREAADTRRDRRFYLRVLLPVVLIILGVIAGAAMANAQGEATAAPDWTTPPCSVYKYTQHPDLPPYTRTDQCYTPAKDGSDNYTISTGDHQWTAAY